MEEKNLDNWQQFEEAIASLEDERTQKKASTSLHISKHLYRGHADSNWKLETTLDRYRDEETYLKDYYRSIFAAKPQIETLTGKTWDIPSPPKYNETLDNEDHLYFFTTYGYDYLIYTRHHGFPSPLLDWTRSPYIAAFFAFRNAVKDGSVSIYVYQEYLGGGKSFERDSPRMQGLGPYVRSHERHFLQQSEYTICTARKDDQYLYTSHDDYVRNNKEDQDKIWKFNIPSSEKYAVLESFDRYNLNAYSLFNNEETLMETMAIRELIFKNNKL